MAPDTIDVPYVARLARLNLSAGEIAEFQCQLGQILDYVQAIRRVDVSGVEPTAHAIRVQNVFRDDVPVEGLAMDRILANAPQQADNHFLVPRIVE